MQQGLASAPRHDPIFEKLSLATFKYLGAPMASTASLQHTFELKAALWLMAHVLLAGSWAFRDGAGLDATACLTPWLEHKDAVIRALAWRASRVHLMACRARDGEQPSSGCMNEIAAVARACRALRACKSVEGSLDALAQAEMMELLRQSLTAVNEREAYVKQILDSGVVSAGLLPSS
jgi:hypothetical protein